MERMPTVEELEKLTQREVVPKQAIDGAIAAIADSLETFSYEPNAGARSRERQQVWDGFVSKNVQNAFETFLAAAPSLSQDHREQLRTLYEAHKTVRWALEEDEEMQQRDILKTFPVREREAKGAQLHNAAIRRHMESASWQQRMAVFIREHRDIEGLGNSMVKFWDAIAEAGERVTGSAQDITKREHGVEHLVTAWEALDEAGVICGPTTAKEDVHHGVDLWGIKKFPEGNAYLLIQVKPLKQEDPPITHIEVLYPFPSQSEVTEEIWNLVSFAKKLKETRSTDRVYPLLVRAPSARTNTSIEEGTGLKRFLRTQTYQAPTAILDKSSAERLHTINRIAPPSGRKKKVIYVPPKR